MADQVNKGESQAARVGGREAAPTWQRPRVVLPTGGPEKVGILPGATDPPTRPVDTGRSDRVSGTGNTVNARVIERPAQGVWKGQDLSIAEPEPWGRDGR